MGDDGPSPSDFQKIESLNAEKTTLFQGRLHIITPHTANFRIHVEEPHDGLPKKYSIATQEQRQAPLAQRDRTDPLVGDNHTTTLANIISTNELGYTPGEVGLLIHKLIAEKADFSAIDCTDFQGMSCFSSIQNNPLKSVIVLGSGSNQYEQSIRELIQYIQTLPRETQHAILSHQDRYQGGHLSHLRLLIRQGKEDIALELLQCNTPVIYEDLHEACLSFGTMKGLEPTQKTCIEMLANRLSVGLTKEQRENCILGVTTRL